MSKGLGVGVVGLGRLGSAYAKYLTGQIKGASLAAVSDIDAATAKSLGAELGVDKTFSNYHDLIQDKRVDAVVIVSPTSTHKDIVFAAADAGKPVFCEKPLSISLDTAHAMLQKVRDTGIFFHMGFMRRFDDAYLAAKHKIDDGTIGTPIVFKSSSRDPYRPSLQFLDPAHSGGLFMDCGIHDLDLARWYMGDIESVYSIGGVLAYPEMEGIGDVDNCMTSVRFKSGCIGTIDLSRSGVYGYDIRTEILGTEGTLKIGYLRETAVMVMTKSGITHDAVPYFTERFGQAYITQLQNFVDNVSQNKPPAITCADGVAALEASAAATLSFKESRPVHIAS
jgi:inositol 2-dehydrogenase